MKEISWETQEVINFLVNDERCYNELSDEDEFTIEEFVRRGDAPEGLYQMFQYENASFDSVDWAEVADSLSTEDDWGRQQDAV
jgi:hypothetical protein